jgi:hypothetical protein
VGLGAQQKGRFARTGPDLRSICWRGEDLNLRLSDYESHLNRPPAVLQFDLVSRNCSPNWDNASVDLLTCEVVSDTRNRIRGIFVRWIRTPGRPLREIEAHSGQHTPVWGYGEIAALPETASLEPHPTLSLGSTTGRPRENGTGAAPDPADSG